MKRALLLASALLFALVLAGTTARAETPPKHKGDKPTTTPAADTGKPEAKTAAPGEMAHAHLKDTSGKTIATATLEETPHGVLITVEVTAGPAGMHAFHIHDKGDCDPKPGAKGPFTSAGGHFNPAAHKHGVKNPEGTHAGDLPNVDVPEGGKLHFQFFADQVTLKAGEKNGLLKEGGTSLVMHKGQDDHMSDPAGNAGDRIACGVVEKGADKK